jgi:hypothetical protein
MTNHVFTCEHEIEKGRTKADEARNARAQGTPRAGRAKNQIRSRQSRCSNGAEKEGVGAETTAGRNVRTGKQRGEFDCGSRANRGASWRITAAAGATDRKVPAGVAGRGQQPPWRQSQQQHDGESSEAVSTGVNPAPTCASSNRMDKVMAQTAFIIEF